MSVIRFLREFALNPATTGAIAPSSSYLAREMVAGLDLQRAHAVLEYGPGTGAFTGFVLERLPPSCRFLAIEMNPQFHRELSDRFPQATVHNGSVADIREICDNYGIASADCVISGLPWAAFSDDAQRRYIDAMMTVLKPGGQFVTFCYYHSLLIPAARRFAATLPRYFSEIRRSRIVWANVPPAFVYRCRR